jgi:hypothetical protein
MKKLEINYDSHSPSWWDTVNNLDPKTRPDIMNEFLFLEDFVCVEDEEAEEFLFLFLEDFVCVEDEEAEEFLEWAAMFPGWEGNPIVVVELDDIDEEDE